MSYLFDGRDHAFGLLGRHVSEIMDNPLMTTVSAIEWTEHTWNPVSGCTKVSPGCKYCYAETMAHRLKAMGARGYEHEFELTLQPSRLNQPLCRKKPTVYFVNSMSDLFHEEVPDDYVDKVIAVIRATPQHTYQVLTKRAERLPKYFARQTPPSNLWLGVSVEDRQYGLPRIDQLRKVDAAVRFLSIEPLLEDLGTLELSGIDWVIIGGESGPNARPMSPEWAMKVRDQSKRDGAAFFFKQWGTWGSDGIRRAKKLNGRLLDGRVWNEYPASGR